MKRKKFLESRKLALEDLQVMLLSHACVTYKAPMSVLYARIVGVHVLRDGKREQGNGMAGGKREKECDAGGMLDCVCMEDSGSSGCKTRWNTGWET